MVVWVAHMPEMVSNSCTCVSLSVQVLVSGISNVWNYIVIKYDNLVAWKHTKSSMPTFYFCQDFLTFNRVVIRKALVQHVL